MVLEHLSVREVLNRTWNHSRFKPADPNGFYESYFLRANHPSRPLAFWIRYTVFSPRGRPHDARGELWAIYFDGETCRSIAVKESVPISDCYFSSAQLEVKIGAATLTDATLSGRTESSSHAIQWMLGYSGDEIPLLLFPESWYARSFPKAKTVVGMPNARYTGSLTVDGEIIPIDGWIGSQNHNWGTRHTDRYAWGQVAGFDNAPDAFLECSSAQIKLGPIWTPRLTLVVLRDQGEEIALNGFVQAVRADASLDDFTWKINSQNNKLRISGHIYAAKQAFVGLRYQNPPGGEKICLNTKLASAEIMVEKRGCPLRTLTTNHRAAFEILTDRSDHGVPIVV